MDEELRERATARAYESVRKAEDLLTHYLRTAWEAAGLTWSDDNDDEVGQIVDLIMSAAQDGML